MDPYNTADAHQTAAGMNAPPPAPPSKAPPALPPARPGHDAGNPYAAPVARVRDAVPFVEVQEPAQRWMRLVAVLLDAAIVLVPTWMMSAVLRSAMHPYSRPSDGIKLLVLLYFMAVIVYLVMQLVMLHRSGQTLGKRLMGIRIVRTDGTRAGLGRILLLRSLIPNLIAAIPYAGGFFVLIDSLFVFAEDRRCLHDRFADTAVVDA
jgi:uncharacterized RDD family membrane protein YckC